LPPEQEKRPLFHWLPEPERGAFSLLIFVGGGRLFARVQRQTQGGGKKFLFLSHLRIFHIEILPNRGRKKHRKFRTDTNLLDFREFLRKTTSRRRWYHCALRKVCVFCLYSLSIFCFLLAVSYGLVLLL
jgi:hypothetical protein